MLRTLLAALLVLGCAGAADAGPQKKQQQATQPAGGGGGSGTGWGCRTCGYSNGTQLTGLKAPSGQASLAPASITLTSGGTIDLRSPQADAISEPRTAP